MTFSQLLSEIRNCRICVEQPDRAPLPHKPRPVIRANPSAVICICGQAPGTRVHNSGKPFTDPSGDRLREWMGIDKETFYDEKRIAIVPMGFCFPGLNEKGGDLPPRKECSQQWHTRVFSQLKNIKLILLVGQYAQRWHLKNECRSNLTETVRAWREYNLLDATPRFLPLPHPSWRNNSWLKKNIWFENEVIPFLRKEVQNLLHV
ncbi:MAG: uracil-DNA glycosylase family protein [Methyloligellaceae bacterium]